MLSYDPTDMNFTVQEMTGRAFFTIPSGMGTAPPTSTPTYVVIPATMQVMNCTNITFYSKVSWLVDMGSVIQCCPPPPSCPFSPSFPPISWLLLIWSVRSSSRPQFRTCLATSSQIAAHLLLISEPFQF